MMTVDRLMRYVEPQPTGCWIWRGHVSKEGYGKCRDGKRMVMAHRISYELQVAKIPDGLTIDHLCENPACVNPSHLEPVTTGENSRRSTRTVQGKNIRKTRCNAGHPLSGDNLRVDPSGKRRCRRCHADREAERRARLWL